MSKNPAAKGNKSGSHNESEVDKVINKMKAKKQEEEEDDEEEDEDEGEEGDDEEGNELGHLPKQVLKRVVAIRTMHSQIEELDAEYKKERISLEQKYLALKKPIFESRDQIISGAVEAPVDETTGPEPESSTDNEEKVIGIPGFWLQCLGAHHITGDLICEDDVPALVALTGIKCDYDESFSSFTLTFTFAENEYFSNTTLTKKYGVSPDLLDEKAPALTLNEGCEIDWKPNKNLTVTELKKKQKAKSGKNKGQVRTIVKQIPKASFFHYFSTPTGEDEEEQPRIKLTMEEDYDVGHTIRTAIIPEAVLWYTGEQVDEEYDDYDEGDEEEDGDEDEQDEDEEDSEEDTKPKGKGGNNKKGFAAKPAAAGATAGANGEQPECKQN